MTTILLLFPWKKRYVQGVPICPKCSATIHAGADDQCPACGYSLRRADELFGDGQVEFTRVVDAAGALTHPERQELLHFLENLERSLPPLALCIYVTDDGQADDFRTHAHWILNHARIHHPSFGRREKHKAIEDAELRLRFARETPPEGAEPVLAEPAPASWLTRLGNYLRDALHPNLPPPVKQEWMLILVLDVQLERACFSWGYQLDPYIDPDSINRSIVGAKFQFRERAMVPGLRRVMKAAVREIASGSRRVNAQLRRSGRAVSALLALAAAACCFSPLPAQAAPSAPPPAAATPAEPDVEVVEEESSQEGAQAPAVPAPAPPAEGEASAASAAPAPAALVPEQGSAATYAAPPRWQGEDYRHLMAGELVDAYSLLVPPADVPRAAQRFHSPPPATSQESDKKVPGRYHEAYSRPSPAGLCDPQGLLSVEERRDVEHVLREVNANGRYRVYATLYRAGQQLPPELSLYNLTTATAKPCEYAVLLLFPLGDAALLDMGYQEVRPSDDDRHAWLRRVREAATPEGGGLESLLLAIREVDAILAPLASAFRSQSPEAEAKLPHIPVELRPDTGEKKVPVKVKIAAFFADETNHPYLYLGGTGLLLLGSLLLVFILRRHSGHLLESVPDVRLSSPYGAGVSRYVRYLEGQESPKESRLF